jgi:hypothetical protein
MKIKTGILILLLSLTSAFLFAQFGFKLNEKKGIAGANAPARNGYCSGQPN